MYINIISNINFVQNLRILYYTKYCSCNYFIYLYLIHTINHTIYRNILILLDTTTRET